MGRRSEEGVYGMGAVAKMLGVPAQTLRTWEDRYGQIIPERSAGGQRLYSRDQVEELRFILEEIDKGMQPADAHRLLAERRRFPLEVRPGPEPILSILIAERDPFSADLCEYLLRTEGYGVRIATDSKAAREMLQDEPPNLAVISLLISSGTGAELCRFVRRHLTIPILATSALDTRDQALDAGADAFLLKPVDPLQFVSTIRDLLGTSAYLKHPVWVQ
jgi:DNA-binding transcriptional MerR regulator